MKNIVLVLGLFFCSYAASAEGSGGVDLADAIKDYRIYSLARCINNNYREMVVDFSKQSPVDNTIGFIDIDKGYAFSINKNNNLDRFIKEETKNFFRPKHKSGDLSTINLVIYDCVNFYHSKKLNDFLKELLLKAEAEL
ncbi:hypothetical protein [Kalamiella sp. sgz302252]|uniref:hypothetical protein n=1 Tax=Pantoea sp. sgz302252 TaxID=3341827 RepID=UPI0036D412B6